MNIELDRYVCMCGESFANPVEHNMHRARCKKIRDLCKAEYLRICALCDAGAISKAAWDKYADKSLPSFHSLGRWYGGWPFFQVAAAGGEVVKGRKYREYLPPPDEQWPVLLGSRDRCVGQDICEEAISALYVGILEVAVMEANRRVGHWRGDLPAGASPEPIIQDARQFLREHNLVSLMKSHD